MDTSVFALMFEVLRTPVAISILSYVRRYKHSDNWKHTKYTDTDILKNKIYEVCHYLSFRSTDLKDNSTVTHLTHFILWRQAYDKGPFT